MPSSLPPRSVLPATTNDDPHVPLTMQPASPEHNPPPEPEAEDAKPTEEVAHGDAEVKAEEAPEAVDEEAVKEHGVVDADERRGARGRKRGRRGSGGAARGLVMVKRELLARCMTCPLCNRLLRDATTVSECLHTFCRKCIYQKFTIEEVESCPVCKIDLGCTPLEKLRADHSLQDVRSKIFPLKRKNIKADEVTPPISLPNKRKERSISSLVVHTPRLTPSGLTGRRTRAVTRKAAAALRGLGVTVDSAVKKENDIGGKHVHSSSLPTNLGKVSKTKRQISTNAEASNRSSSKDKEGDSQDMSDSAELWRPLNCLVEVANRTKSFRSSSQSPVVKAEQLNDSPSSTYANKTKPREYLQKCKIEDDRKDVPTPPVMLKKKVPGTARRKRAVRAPANGKQNEKKISSIWFSLVASFEQKGDPPLPQIPSHYLRIKDGNVPASSLQKYLMQKLNLPSESEVEINCCGEPVNPTQPLRNLVELWLKGRPTQTAETTIGSSAEEFVMVLTYGRPKAIAS